MIQALRGMGYTEQADHYTHFSYEMVALTPRCAEELGYSISDEDKKKSYIEVSGRKGFGVKADDLIDKLIAATRAEVEARQTGGAGENAEAERQKIARQIAIGALRYFMLKFTRNSVIAFDFKDALSFEGETGPYIQYAVVRIRNIFRKGGTTPEAVLAEFASVAPSSLSDYFSGEENEDIWSLWLRAGRRSQVLDQCIARPSRPISPSTPSSSRRSSPTSTIATTSSRKRTPRAKPSSSPLPQSHCANSSRRSHCSASKAPKRCNGSCQRPHSQ